ncbi:MAG: PhoH family protein [Candidatus Adiutrix sp.]|jgi:phosphate starvation-inducible PhoH-like protein|nr:PhoH family protein [Candidatus Adiutrix sp.]
MSARRREESARNDSNGESVSRRSYGPGSANLKLLARLLGLNIGQRGSLLSIGEGPAERRAAAEKVIGALNRMAADGVHPGEWDTECLVNLALDEPQADLLEYIEPRLASSLTRRRVAVRNPAQKAYLEAMAGHDLVFGLGPAGTGKTYLAVAMAVAALGEGQVGRIIITRPAVEAGERLGFLPGDLAEKINPYLRPLYDALDDLIPYEKYVKLSERRVIEVAPLAFMRGRTLGEAFVILDEAQNCTREQMKMFLTRLGPGSRAVVTGDPGQSDLPGGDPAGLKEAVSILSGLPGIAFCRFSPKDVIRHRLVKKIIEAYEQAASRTPPQGSEK